MLFACVIFSLFSERARNKFPPVRQKGVHTVPKGWGVDQKKKNCLCHSNNDDRQCCHILSKSTATPLLNQRSSNAKKMIIIIFIFLSWNMTSYALLPFCVIYSRSIACLLRIVFFFYQIKRPRFLSRGIIISTTRA
jgi:hypothetical protein